MQLYIKFPTWLRPEIIPGLPFRWYGLMYLLSFAVAYLMFRYQVKERGLEVKQEVILNYFFWGIIGLLIGARIFAAIIYDPSGKYLTRPWLIFWPFANGRFTGIQGMSYHGGLVGAIAAILIYSRVKKINTLDWGDMLVTGIPLGYTFGRLGNFINGELYGRVTTASWGILFPNAARFSAEKEWVREAAAKTGIEISGTDAMVNLPRHPSQLYEAFFEGIVLWAILWFVFRKRKPFNGFMVSLYVIGYGFFRFFIEYFRQPDEGLDFVISLSSKENPPYLLVTPWNFTTGQILCILMIIGGVLSLFIFKYLADRKPKVETYDKDQKESKKSMRKLRKKIK